VAKKPIYEEIGQNIKSISVENEKQKWIEVVRFLFISSRTLEIRMRVAFFLLIILLPATLAVAQEPAKTIHVFVALCDNDNQGIVPVPKKLGNGDDPGNNLYWGALYGIKTFLKKSKDWDLLITSKNPTHDILERAIFRHKGSGAYLVAEAYRGAKIRKAIVDFLNAAAGNNSGLLKLGEDHIRINGSSDLAVYVGHNGLMDFNIEETKRSRYIKANDAIVLACKSKPYFQPLFSKLGCASILLTTGFMAPEAYSLKAALDGWLTGESGKQIRERAAHSYHKFQKCGLYAARRLFYSDE
jgi:hypothetical protein